MRVSVKFLLAASALGVAIGSLACGSAPSSPLDATPVGATVQGTVNAGASASSQGVRALSGAGGGLRVTVVGTSLQTTTNADGQFVLQGVPPGSVSLRFQGSGVDATLEISGLVEGQVLTITVHVDGDRAEMEDSSPDEVEFTGAIESISPPNLRVAGRDVVTNSGTEIENGDASTTLASLQVGDTVKVEGIAQADGSVLAREIKRLDGQNNADDDDDGDDDHGDRHGDDDHEGDDHRGGDHRGGDDGRDD